MDVDVHLPTDPQMCTDGLKPTENLLVFRTVLEPGSNLPLQRTKYEYTSACTSGEEMQHLTLVID